MQSLEGAEQPEAGGGGPEHLPHVPSLASAERSGYHIVGKPLVQMVSENSYSTDAMSGSTVGPEMVSKTRTSKVQSESLLRSLKDWWLL